ncbi:MAG TPA: MT-A70 family methyltransferase [Streptosporangiaceae bacterium]
MQQRSLFTEGLVSDALKNEGRLDSPLTFSTILADPPWDTLQRSGRGAHRHYPLMTVEAIAALPVGDLVSTDAHLWLWVTNATLFAGQAVIEAWGFTYRSCLTWVKPGLGLGSSYLRNNTEHLLFGTRGKAPILYRCQPTWLFAPKQDHSHKPEEQYAVIERCSPGPYLELFARRKQPGWHVWGNEVENDVVL